MELVTGPKPMEIRDASGRVLSNNEQLVQANEHMKDLGVIVGRTLGRQMGGYLGWVATISLPFLIAWFVWWLLSWTFWDPHYAALFKDLMVGKPVGKGL